MKKVLLYFERFLQGIATLCMFGIVVVTFLQVFSRYVVGAPFMWTEELARTLGIWCVMVATGVVLKNNEHVGFDLIPDRFKPYQRLLTNVAATFFAGALVNPSVAHLQVAFGRVAPTMGVPLWTFHLAMIVGICCLLIWGAVGTINSMLVIIDMHKKKKVS